MQEFPHLHYGSEEGPTLWIVPHLRGERGRVSCHSSGSLEGGGPSSAEVIEDTEDFFQIQGLYSLFTAFERFLELFLFDTFFIKVWEIF